MLKAFDFVKGGHFSVGRGGRVTGVAVTPGPLAAKACGRRRLRVSGDRALIRSSTRAGLAVWILGKRARNAQDGAAPVPVRLTQAGKGRRGRLALSFDGRRRALGQLRLGACRLRFEARR